MTSEESRQIRARLVKGRGLVDTPLAILRQQWDDEARRVELPPGIAIDPVDAAEVPGEWVSSPYASVQRVLLYLHGGGYSAGSCLTHRELAARLSLASGARVLLLDYRLAPEHPFPAAVEDAVTGYGWLIGRGIAPAQVAVGGDSAGGGLAVAALLRARERGVPLPAASVLLSPWVDLALAGPSLQTHAEADPLTSPGALRAAVPVYLGAGDPRHPLASPLYADLRGLPPLLIQAGGDEVLLSDATRLAERARAAGVEVVLEVWEGMWHVWQAWAGVLPEGRQAIERVGAFLRARLAGEGPR